MNKRRITAIVMSLILVVTSLATLISCNKKYEITFREKGSKVFSIKNENLPTPVVDTFMTFDEYKSSKYADMKLGGFDAPTRDIFYDKQYFKTHNLIAVKFNDYTNIEHFIESVHWIDDTHYDVDMTRIHRSGTSTYSNAPIGTFVCFLEFPKDRDITNAKVSFNISNHNAICSKAGKSILVSEEPLNVSVVESYDDFNSYYARVDAKTQNALNSYDASFFDDNYLLIVDYYFDSENIATIDASEPLDWLLDIHVYASDHFTTNPRHMDRTVHYFPFPNDVMIQEVSLSVYYESDFGDTNKRNNVYTARDLYPNVHPTNN